MPTKLKIIKPEGLVYCEDCKFSSDGGYTLHCIKSKGYKFGSKEDMLTCESMRGMYANHYNVVYNGDRKICGPKPRLFMPKLKKVIT